MTAAKPQIAPKQEAVRRLMRYRSMGLDGAEALILLRDWNNTSNPQLKDEELVALIDSLPAPKKGVGNELNFNPVSAQELFATEPEPVTWVWDPFLPKGGLALLAAQPKAGKSTLAYALAVAVSGGEPFLGYPTTRGGVLILGLEEHLRDIKLRLKRFRGRPDQWIYVHAGPLDTSAASLAAIKAFIREHDIKLVIVDTLARFWRVKDENDNAELGAAVAPLLDLARGTGATVLLVHHERKAKGEDGKGIRGGSALLALVDQALQLEKRKGGASNHRTLTSFGRYAETPPKVILELKGDEYRLLGTAANLTPEEDKRKVLAVLAAGPSTVESLIGTLNLSEKRIREALEAFSEQIVREGKGVRGDPHIYRLPADSIPSQSPPTGEERNWDDLLTARPVDMAVVEQILARTGNVGAEGGQ